MDEFSIGVIVGALTTVALFFSICALVDDGDDEQADWDHWYHEKF